MIVLRASAEFMTDIFTPGIVTPNHCTEGLPKNVKLVDVNFDDATGIVTFYYDDGVEDETVLAAKYNAVLQGVETV